MSELQEREQSRALDQAEQVKVLLEEGQTHAETIELLEISRGELRKLLDALAQQAPTSSESPPVPEAIEVKEVEQVEQEVEAAPVAS